MANMCGEVCRNCSSISDHEMKSLGSKERITSSKIQTQIIICGTVSMDIQMHF